MIKFTPTYYPGAKAQDVVWQQIINLFPPHRHYVELFAGSAQILRHKKPATGINMAIDVDKSVADNYSGMIPKQAEYVTMNAFQVLRDMCSVKQKTQLAIQEISTPYFPDEPPSWIFDRETLVYLDPPYPFEARRDKQRKLYGYELNDGDHRVLCNLIKSVRCMVAISTYPNDLYNDYLANWHYTDIQTANHGGPAIERVYTNYKPGPLLHQYDFVGKNNMHRQILKRKVARYVGKFKAFSPIERNAIIEALTQQGLLK
jgi:DNA adenine methylase